jgi:hypothetical protein
MPQKDLRIRADHYDAVKQARKDFRTVTHDDPTPEDQELRSAMSTDLEQFLKTCFPQAYSLDFSPDHVNIIEALYRTVTQGQKKAIAMPRGSGKTTLCTHAALFALLYGYRDFLFIVAADLNAAKNLIAGLKNELSYNENLARFFPEVCTYFAACENNSHKANHQLNEEGEKTGLQCGSEKVVFPMIPNSISSEAVVEAAGITGRIRGSRHARMDGRVIRPDVVLIDDPSTDESAHSDAQNEKRLNIIKSDILGMSGPDSSMSCLVACTVIAPDDLAEQLLDRKICPEFRGEKCKILYSFPENDDLWRQYEELYRSEGEEDRDHDESLSFYKKNQEAMDEGAKAGWPDRYIRGSEITAIQHAMNLKFELGDDAFYSEYMNEPQVLNANEYSLNLNLVCSRVNRLPRLVVHPDVETVTSHVDINYSGLHWSIVGHSRGGLAYIIDYGRYPETEPLVSPEEAKVMSDMEIDQRIYEQLSVLHRMVFLQKELMKEGKRVPIDLMGVDAGYRMKTIFRFCGNMKIQGLPVMPTVGRASKNYRPSHLIGAPGDSWNVQKQAGKIQGNSVFYNADVFRERQQRMWLPEVGAPGSISIFGQDPREHKDLGRHVIAEELVEKVHGEVETMYVWRAKPGSVWDLADTLTVNLVLGAATGIGPWSAGAGRGFRPRKKSRKKVRTGNI